MMALGSVRSQYLDGGYGLDCAQDTAAVMDKAVKAILDVCYQDAVKVIQENLDDMHKVVAYLLEKETITGGEMVAIIEGRDPALVENAYASTRQPDQPAFRPSQPDRIEPPARHIHMISEEIKPPAPDEEDQSQENAAGTDSRDAGGSEPASGAPLLADSASGPESEPSQGTSSHEDAPSQDGEQDDETHR